MRQLEIKRPNVSGHTCGFQRHLRIPVQPGLHGLTSDHSRDECILRALRWPSHREVPLVEGLTEEISRAPKLSGTGSVDRITFMNVDGAAKLAVFQNQKLKFHEVPFTASDTTATQATVDYSDEWYWIPCIGTSPNSGRIVTVQNEVGLKEQRHVWLNCYNSGNVDPEIRIDIWSVDTSIGSP